MENSPRMKEMFVELEWWIEQAIGLPRIQTKQMKMYKGTTKKWQILDDAAFSKEQIDKLQAATNAPSAETLDYWREKHDRPMTLPITNANVQKWRDEPRAIESADFDPAAILAQRNVRKQEFLERYEVPKQLASESH